MSEEGKVINMVGMGDPLEVSTCYEINFDKVKDIKDVIEILKGIPIYLFLRKSDYAKHPIKKYLKESEDESTVEESDS